MRIVTLVVALAAGCALSPALAQTVPQPAPPQAQDRGPAPGSGGMQSPPVKLQDQMPSEAQRESLALPPAPRGRYSFAPVDEGFLRFDHKSGDVALCKAQNGGWSCDAVADSSAAQRKQAADPSDKEIAGLRAQVAALQKEVAGLRAPPPPPYPAPPQTVPPSDETGSITLKQDIARARGFITETWHRLVEMITNLQKDVMRKS
jgi:hypothetical protein